MIADEIVTNQPVAGTVNSVARRTIHTTPEQPKIFLCAMATEPVVTAICITGSGFTGAEVVPTKGTTDCVMAGATVTGALPSGLLWCGHAPTDYVAVS
ncbi:MAG: hypothetical protein OXF02_08155 [Simkaniaceae bacterium]|nr:hypothetical protein [Simkaniaceae bacterium]